MSYYKITRKGGGPTIFTPDLSAEELFNRHPIAACIMSGCQDTNDYVLYNLSTGVIIDPRELQWQRAELYAEEGYDD